MSELQLKEFEMAICQLDVIWLNRLCNKGNHKSG